MSAADLQATFFSPRDIRIVRDALQAADPAGPPTAVFLPNHLVDGRMPARLGVFSGSFNPLTLAHTAVARAAQRQFHLDRTVFALSTRTTDKEEVSGLLLEDRLLTLQLAAQRRGLGVMVLNCGLYVEQAEALRRALPDLQELRFVVGFDKIVQVFDRRYYADRDEALDQLFGLASFTVAPRGNHGPEALAALLGRPENRKYAGRVQGLALPERYRDLASTDARSTLETGHRRVAGLPAEAIACLRATGAYGPAYRIREEVLDWLEARREELSRPEMDKIREALNRAGKDGGAALRTVLAWAGV